MTVHSLAGNYPAGDQMTTSELKILVPQQQMTAEPIQHLAQHLPSEEGPRGDFPTILKWWVI